MHSLQDLCVFSYEPGHLVARESARTRRWDEFMADVTCSRQLFKGSGNSNWALFETDSYRFAVGLVALLAEAKTVYLPGENHERMIAALQKHGAAFAGQFPTHETLQVVTGKAPDQLTPLSLSGSVVVFTSGSTGDAKPIHKTLGQLDAELAALELSWGQQLENSVVAGTVSHQHFYGLLFSLLWPLVTGRCFWHKPFVDPAIMARTLSDFPAAAWVMSPAHLHRLSKDMPWSDVRDSVTAVFSSGGPLEQHGAQTVYDALGEYPIEVLGSSETGGIAWRQQENAASLWATLPGVKTKISEQGALAVQSGWLPNDEWYATSDLASQDRPGGFSLGARLDRIIKVEGKRVSLPEAEFALGEHPWIELCALTGIQRRRQVIGAAMVLSPTGARRYAELGHHHFTRALRHYLGDHLAAAAIPRVWRVTSTLPRNSQGKILQRAVRELFDSGTLPRVLNRQNIENGCILTLQVQQDNPYFEGHFTGSPVLPGVAQLVWAQQLATNFIGVKGHFLGMKKIKFKELVFPRQELTLTLTYTPADGCLNFQYKSLQRRHSQGTLLYEVCP